MRSFHQRNGSFVIALLFSLAFGLFMAGSGTASSCVRAADTIRQGGQFPQTEAIITSGVGLISAAVENTDLPDDRKSSHLEFLALELSGGLMVAIHKDYHTRMINRVTFVHRDTLFPTHYYI